MNITDTEVTRSAYPPFELACGLCYSTTGPFYLIGAPDVADYGEGSVACAKCKRAEARPHCQYFDDSDHERCPKPPCATVEPKPIGQFAPVTLCVEHTIPWTRDLANLGNDWSIVALSVDCARILGSLQ